MAYSELKSKTKRLIARDLQTLFSPRAFFSGGIDDVRKLGQRALFRNVVQYKGRSLLLSDDGDAALENLSGLILEAPSL